MIQAISNSISPVKCSKKGNVYEGTNAAKVAFPVAALACSVPLLKDVYKSADATKEGKIAKVVAVALETAIFHIGLGAIVDGIFNWNRGRGADANMETLTDIAALSQAQQQVDEMEDECDCPECSGDDCVEDECDCSEDECDCPECMEEDGTEESSDEIEE